MRKRFSLAVLGILIISVAVFSLPILLASTLQYVEAPSSNTALTQFPVTVDPRNKIIVESAQVNALFASHQSPFQAAVENTGSTLWNIFEWLATTISSMPWYQSLAATDGRFVTITPGMRKEQVAGAFGKALLWNTKQEKAFVTADASSTLPLVEGSFLPGTYLVTVGTTPAEAQKLIDDRFTQAVLTHYGTTTAEVVPLDQALTVASLIQREAGGADDMRIISGIIWNRLFANMNLQIDATVQYAKANNETHGSWWPRVTPADISRKSAYNTYLHPGLPPTPIANPSVAAVLAALNPVNTSCMFYFHDKAGQFHCSDTYAQHVALLKKYYGQGK
jgi:UPF0755 protein